MMGYKKAFFFIILPLTVAFFVLIVIKDHFFINHEIRFSYPWKTALFPRDFASPTFKWYDQSKVRSWKITINLKDKNPFVSEIVNEAQWKPDSTTWNNIKRFSNFDEIEVLLERNIPNQNPIIKQKARLFIKISPDEVGAPILYREIPLPFFFAEQNISLASYSLYNVRSYKPPHVVLGQFKVCGNCHSITRDGKTIALDFDASKRDKGGYFISDIDSVIVFDKNNYISWSRLQGHSTFGLFSKISWSGRYIVTTVKDRVVSKAFEELDAYAYSQLFFPVNGILVVYDRVTKKLWELPGANDTSYVQSNAVWTPDDKYIIFARSKALPYPDKKSTYYSMINDEKLIDDFVKGRKMFKYDLYIIPFNDGKGGEPQPIKGASMNGKSNYFPAVSPDGKWIVYCQSNSFMMLRPDSRLFIIPIEGGKSRELECNFPSMNSWHAWAPNSKWMVYVSKYLNMYTDMYLTHIDEKGHASIPVLLENSKKPNCAVNYPEFINRDPSFTFTMDYNYINTIYILDAIYNGDLDKARVLLKKYFDQGFLSNPAECEDIGVILYKLGNKTEAEKYFQLSRLFDSYFFRRF